MKISVNASFSLQLFVIVHIPPVFSLLLTKFTSNQQLNFLTHHVGLILAAAAAAAAATT